MLAAAPASAAVNIVLEITTFGPAGTFQQTWTLDDGMGVTTLFPDFELYGHVGVASATDTALTAGLLADSHVAKPFTFQSYDFTRGVDPLDAANGSLGLSFGQAGDSTFDVDDTYYAEGHYSVTLHASDFGFFVPSAVPTLADLTDYLQSGTTLIWSERGEASRFFKSNGRYDGDIFIRETIGLARVVSVTEVGAAVPEPAAWAIMILGFATAGAALRRRSRAPVRHAA